MRQRKEVKLKDIAESLGISIVTVSNALKGKAGVSEELRKKIRQKAKELSYELPENWGQRDKHYRFGVVIAKRYVKEYPSFYMDIYKHIAQTTSRYGGLTILEVIDEEKEKHYVASSLFKNVEIDGILIVGEMNMDFIAHIQKECVVPVVCIDFYDVDHEADYIVTDGYRGMQKITQELIDYGHTEIGFVGTPQATQSIMDRYMGFCKALEKNGLKENPDWLIHDREPHIYGGIFEIQIPEKLPSAFACNCYNTAHALIELLRKRGLRVPEDISVVSYDSVYPEYREGLKLTTYDSNGKGMSQKGVKVLLQRIEKKKGVEGIHFIEGKVISGNTIKRVQGGMECPAK